MKKILTIVLATILLAVCFFAYAAAETKTTSSSMQSSTNMDAADPYAIVSFHQFD